MWLNQRTALKSFENVLRNHIDVDFVSFLSCLTGCNEKIVYSFTILQLVVQV
jgi:hypothetical protein